MAGGQREVGLLNEELQKVFKQEGILCQMDGFTIERQCNADFFQNWMTWQRPMTPCCRWLVVQAFSSLLIDILRKPVFPALNTIFVGVDRDIGWFEENCRACRECVLGETAEYVL